MSAGGEYGAVDGGEQRLANDRAADSHQVAWFDGGGVVDEDVGEFFEA